MPLSTERREKLNYLRRECSKLGISPVCRINGIDRLEGMIADPYPHQIATFRRKRGIDSFDFREKGIVPKKNAWIKWKSLVAWERRKYRCEGRFLEMVSDRRCRVSYRLVWPGGGYKMKVIEIDIFQIVDYSEEK